MKTSSIHSLLRLLLWTGALFYFAEGVLHFFGLPILEHDKIFLPTHDRYIAIMAVTYGALLVLISNSVRKHRTLFVFTMIGILVQGINAGYITAIGGYRRFFETQRLDHSLRLLGNGYLLWYITTWIVWLKAIKLRQEKSKSEPARGAALASVVVADGPNRFERRNDEASA